MIRWDRSKGSPEPVALLDRVIERENGEPLVDLRDVAPSVVIARERTIPYLRKTVAAMLEEAARRLPSGYRLAATDCWRPLARQMRIYDWLMQCAREAYPNAPLSALRRRVNRWAAPYDRKAPPGHCTGGAVDVILLDEQGQEVDVVSPLDRFAAARTYTLGLSEEAQRHRTLLVETMLGVGFSNCRDEWWHYSYGDAAWAVRTGRRECFYGLVELDESLYAEAERRWHEDWHQRPNPFLTKV